MHTVKRAVLAFLLGLSALRASAQQTQTGPLSGVTSSGTGNGYVALSGSTSGTVTITVPAAAGTPTDTLGTNSGTVVVSADSPFSVSATTGDLSVVGSQNYTFFMSGANQGALSSAILVGSTGATGQLDFGGVEYHISTGPSTFTTLSAAITSGATSATLTSATGYPSCSANAVCYALIGRNTFTPEVVSYSTIVSGTVTFVSRGLFALNAASAQSSGADFELIGTLFSDSTTVSPWYMKVYNGAAYKFPTISLINYANGNYSATSTYEGMDWYNGSSVNTAFGSYGWCMFGGVCMAPDGNNGFQMSSLAAIATQIAYMDNAGLEQTAGNHVIVTAAQNIATTSFTSTTLAFSSLNMIAIYANRNLAVHCSIIYEQANAVSTVQFALGMSVAPTAVSVFNKMYSNNTTIATWPATAYTSITSTTITAISAATAPQAVNTAYQDEIDFTIVPVSNTNPVLTIYAASGSTSDAVVIEPGSECHIAL